MKKFLLSALLVMIMATTACAALVDVDTGRVVEIRDLGEYAAGRPLYMIFSTIT